MSSTPDDGETSSHDARRGLIQALAARLGFGQRARRED